MKKIILNIFAVAAFCFGATAQNVNIPDANFKAYLVGNASINTNNDLEIQVSEAAAFTGVMVCSFNNITDMTGIEAFTGLEFLHCNDNALTTLDISQNTALLNLNFSNNNISDINVSQNVNLTYLHGNNNNLNSIDLSQNTALINVQFGQNNLSTINVTQNAALTDLDFFDNNLSTIDVSQNTALTDLHLANNNLATIDVSQNSNLSRLTLTYNNLSSIDVSQNSALTELSCNHNNISTLDLSPNSNLSKLFCGNNNLSALKLKNLSASTMNVVNTNGNSNLTCIEVNDVAAATANITFLNIDNWTSLSTSCSPIVNIPDANFKACLLAYTNINTNGDSEIQVSEANAFTGSFNCVNQNISDLTGIEAFTSMIILDCSNNNLSSLDISQNTALKRLFCANNNLSNLDVTQNSLLEYIVCGDNNLNSLDISQNTNLYNFQCQDNNLSSLDVSSHWNLTNFRCQGNNLTSLDVSNNTQLQDFQCQNNQLTSLNIKNVNWSVFWVNATANPNLTCIEVSDVAMATAASTNIDPQTSFSENCSVVAVTSINVQGQGGATTISTLGGTLQMEAEVFPMNATDNTYTWSVINLTGSATIDANGLLTAMTNGTVKVGVTANDGSGVTGSVNITISNQSSSIGELSTIPTILIYPNPTNTQINIDSKDHIQAISILDMMGKTVKTIVAPNQTIDVSDLTKGIYFLQIKVDETLMSKKIIKE